ncbi:NUDIX hydrolase [Pseudomonas aeruginosa]|nr:NUDIX hydrolase [Pseudomonas aeruginosa]
MSPSFPTFVEYQPNDGEIAAVFNVPLSFFRDDPREVTHRIDYFGRSWYVPSYRFGEFKIWGLTAIMGGGTGQPAFRRPHRPAHATGFLHQTELTDGAQTPATRRSR